MRRWWPGTRSSRAHEGSEASRRCTFFVCPARSVRSAAARHDCREGLTADPCRTRARRVAAPPRRGGGCRERMRVARERPGRRMRRPRQTPSALRSLPPCGTGSCCRQGRTGSGSARPVALAQVLGGLAADAVRWRERGERSEHAAGALLAGKAVAEADAERLAVDFDAELAATAGRTAHGAISERFRAASRGPASARPTRAGGGIRRPSRRSR